MVQDSEAEWKCPEMDGEAADAGADVDEVEQGAESDQAVENEACSADSKQAEPENGKDKAGFPEPSTSRGILIPECKQAM